MNWKLKLHDAFDDETNIAHLPAMTTKQQFITCDVRASVVAALGFETANWKPLLSIKGKTPGIFQNVQASVY